MNQKPPLQAVPTKKGDGDVELKARLLKRLNFLQEKVERFDFYIKKAKELLADESPGVSMLEIEKWISGIEKEMGFGGSESVKEFELGSSKMTDDTADRKLGNVAADKQDSTKNEKVGMETDSGDFSALRDDNSKALDAKYFDDIDLTASETLDDILDQDSEQKTVTDEEIAERCGNRSHQIGVKVATGGWFVNDGDFALLTHEDGCCSLYDVTNREEKHEFKPHVKVPVGIWRDCWILRVPSVDGCSGKYVVAASAGNTKSGFCSWEFYDKAVHAFHLEDPLPTSRAHPTAPSIIKRHKSDALPVVRVPPANSVLWWYKPCGPLIVSTGSTLQTVKVFDIRDGELVMKFQSEKPISMMEYCSPLQWRDKGKVILAESDTISLWDVNSLSPRALVSAQTTGNQKITALHIGNTDAEWAKGVRKRVSQTGAFRNDGVLCTAGFITLLDFRHPTGAGFSIPISNIDATSVFSFGDTVLLGGCHLQSAGKRSLPQVQQFSLRKQKPVTVSTYPMPDSSNPSISDNITQVWGDSDFVMAVSSLGLGRFLSSDYNNTDKGVVIGPGDMHDPSFDFASSRILLISRDRPAQWMHII